MKYIFSFLIFLNFSTFGQDNLSKTKSSTIQNVMGNNNVIKVYQGDGFKVYNLADEKQQEMFLTYLKTLPFLNADVKKILSYDKKIYALLSKLAEKANSFGAFDIEKFSVKLAEKIEENTKLKIEIDNLRSKNKDSKLEDILLKAQVKLENFDDVGYQELLEDFKQQKKINIEKERKEVAQISFLQAKNNKDNYFLDKALQQIDEAINNDPENSDYFNEKGRIYEFMGKYNFALEYFQKALFIHEKTLGKENLITSVDYSNLGTIYLMTENYDKAQEYLQKSLSIDEKILGENHPKTSIRYNNLGAFFRAIGNYKIAIEYFQKSLTIDEKTLEKESLTISIRYNNIGLCYQEMGDFTNAIKYLNEALRINDNELAKDLPFKARIYGNIGLSYRDKKEYNLSLEYSKKALNIDEKILGNEHPKTAVRYSNIAFAYDDKGDYAKAVEYAEKALNINEKTFGKESSYTVSDFLTIGKAYIKNGEKEKGVKFLNKTIFKEEEQYLKATQINGFGVEAYNKYQFSGAINLFNYALELLIDSKISESDVLYFNLYQNLALAYCYSRDKTKSLAMFKKVIKLGEKKTKLEIENILKNYNNCFGK